MKCVPRTYTQIVLTVIAVALVASTVLQAVLVVYLGRTLICPTNMDGGVFECHLVVFNLGR